MNRTNDTIPADSEICSDCQRPIGNDEQVFVANGQIVCEQCFSLRSIVAADTSATVDTAEKKQPMPEPTMEEQIALLTKQVELLRTRVSPMANAAMIMGILGFALWPCSVLAIIFGMLATTETKKTERRAGKAVLLGILGLVLQAIFWIVLIVVLRLEIV